MEELLQDLERLAAGQAIPDLYLIRAAHSAPPHGATWTVVSGGGEVKDMTNRPGQPDEPPKSLGSVAPTSVAALARTLLQTRFHELRPSGPPRPGGGLVEIQVVKGEARLTAAVPPADYDRPEAREIAQAFGRLRAEATLPKAPTAPDPGMDVSLGCSYWGIAIVGGLFTFGIVTIVMVLLARRMPRRLDAEGVTLRNGRRFRWSELRHRARVTPEGLVLGYDLLAPDGTEIRLTPGGFSNGRAVCEYALARLR